MIEARLNELPVEERDLLIEKLVSMSGVAIPTNLGKELILSWEEVREMGNNGIVFGAHTVTHPILTKLPLKEAQREIIESKRCIEEQLGQAVSTFAYPSGQPTDFNDGIKESLKESGFICAVTAAPMRRVAPGMDVFELRRIPPGWDFYIFKFFLELYSDLQAISKRIR